MPDALLTDTGKLQASSWRGRIGELGAEVVLVSPLRRAVQTACFAFEGDPAPLELCRSARELWWDERANQPGTPVELRRLLARLPRGSEVQGVDEALTAGPEDPATEKASVTALQGILAMRPETVVAVVCHYGVINAMIGESPANCEVFDCEYKQSGRLKVVHKHPSPAGPRTIS